SASTPISRYPSLPQGADMDFDSYQHYFYDYDCGEDFYRSTAPSEDIWKKFELVPSPPTSPPWGSGPGAGDSAPGIGPPEPWPGGGAGDEAEFRGHSKAWGRNYASIIRRDCMWSGFSARERLERAVSDRLAASAPRGNPPKAPAAPDCAPSLEAGNPAPAAPCPLGEPKTQACSGSESPSDSGKDRPAPSKGGHPQVVFLLTSVCLHLNGEKCHLFPPPQPQHSVYVCVYLCVHACVCVCVCVFLMGCVSSLDLSWTEGEEIDVVTVEKRQSLGVRKPVTITVRADPLDPCMKHFHISIHQQQHNYAARFPPESCSQGGAPERGPQEEALENDVPEEKEEEADEEIVSPPPVESEAPQSCHPKPVSSDTEDVTKRKNHNFLERKRRNDLRSRFLALRDQVPTLASCSKAPKVVILSKALEYLQALVGAEKRMATEKRQLRCRQQQLQKRIAYLSGY
ncbi:MYCL protein, partial [Crocuta crocuta]